MKNSNMGRLGFTLIELLVVVLIIGILAAVALPQYQKAVWKARNTQLKLLVKAVAQAERAYFLANGEYANNFNQLDIDLPLEASGTTPGTNIVCGTAVQGSDSVRTGDGFAVVLNGHSDDAFAVAARYTAGKYKCAGFSASNHRDFQLTCSERIGANYFTEETGAFCKQIEKGTLVREATNSLSALFSLP